MSTIAERAAAARAVLAGGDVLDVARRAGVEPELVARWADLYAEGGELRLAGHMDPASFEARDRFLPLVAHEFRTPLTVIKGWVELIQAGLLDAESVTSAVQVIAEQVVALERTIADAIDAGAVARHRLRLDVAPFDLRELVAGLLISTLASVELVAGPPVAVLGDRDRLERVAVSVLGHARRLAAGVPVRAAVSETAAGDAITEISIVGRSIGFEQVAELFEPYDREDTSIATGLGLFLSRSLVVAHGGEIGVRSEGEDTCFWFRVPTAGPEPSTERTPR